MSEHGNSHHRGILRRFEAGLRTAPDFRRELAAGIVGKSAKADGPFGQHPIIYADYVASGRAVGQVERFILDEVLPFYANSHTEASYCGGRMTWMREEAREIILEKCGGNAEEHAVIFTGSGATAAINQLVHLLGVARAIARGVRVRVLIGPYEHHSNILPWREIGAEVTEIDEAATGGVDLHHLECELSKSGRGVLVIGAFSAASNVTGVGTDIAAVTRLVKCAGGKVVWDFAGGGPYLPVDLAPSGECIDAIALSPHKFIGGPGASGVLIVRREAVAESRPSRPGGGTVAFVNDKVHDYLQRIEDREEGGTPNVIGDIRAALTFIVKDVIGTRFIVERNQELTQRVFAAWGNHSAIRILGADRRERLPIFSFIVDAGGGKPFEYQLFTRALSDLYGIQARGGCACAGPYVHRLLQIDEVWSERLRAEIRSGDESNKPGFVRLNLSALMSDQEVTFILNAVSELADRYSTLAQMYASAGFDVADIRASGSGKSGDLLGFSLSLTSQQAHSTENVPSSSNIERLA